MKINQNHRIISLSITIFISVSLNTVYMPVWTYISENNKLVVISLYQALSSGNMMTILTISAGYSFNHNTNGIGF